MPKLFELYVYSKLNHIIRPGDSIIYHACAGRQELDYLCSIKELAKTTMKSKLAIIDAKYKLCYKTNSLFIDLDDARQLSGYARLKSVHDKLHELGMPKHPKGSMIPCLVVHPTLDSSAPYTIDFNRLRKSQNWLEFYLLDIRLPEHKIL